MQKQTKQTTETKQKTGGRRGWGLEKGCEEVYHLRGGILKYIEEVAQKDSLWEGECFVFDSRVTVDHDLDKGQYELCYACRHALSPEDMSSIDYERGISCPHCIDDLTPEKRQRFGERMKQLALAELRQH